MSATTKKQNAGIPQHAPNIIEQMDVNYAQELAKLPASTVLAIDPGDHIEMRKWLVEEYMAWPRAPVAEARSRVTLDVQSETIPITYGEGCQFAVQVHVPKTEEAGLRPALIMYHGGGWIHGFPNVDEGVADFFASELRAVIINVDYRLAPEHPFPAPLDDCYEAIQWTIDHAAEYKIDKDRIGLWGCSAGGNLAAGVALRDAKEHRVSRICHANLVVPVTCHPDLYPEELKMGGSSTLGGSEKYRKVLREIWDKYAGTQFSHEYVSVLVASTPSNHPPVHITVAGQDELRDEGIAYAIRLRNASIDAQLEIVPGVPHGITVPVTTHASRQFFRNQARVLDYALNMKERNI